MNAPELGHVMIAQALVIAALLVGGAILVLAGFWFGWVFEVLAIAVLVFVASGRNEQSRP